jgi:DNA-binding NarL/FixJ family response regulator
MLSAVGYVSGVNSALEAAHDAHRRHDWFRAHDAFTLARAADALAVADVEAFADTAWWLGRNDEALALYEEVYRLHVNAGLVPQAARMAMGIGFLSFLRGEAAVGSGWIGRARRLIRDAPECVEHGYLLAMEMEGATAAGDFTGAVEQARQVQAIADLYRDTTLTALGLVGEGIALVKQGRVDEGLSVLDEAMLPVRAGEVEPSFVGNIYCQMMAICHELADLPRARTWTEVTERWCAGFPSAVMFAGICRIHRVQLMQVQGLWRDAEREAQRVCEELAAMNVFVVAEGHYEVGEIRRLRDDPVGAEAAYRLAHQLGREPQPGLAMLRLAQGRLDAATAAIRTALTADGGNRLTRAPLLAAQIEIALACDDVTTAATASAELHEIAAAYRSVGFEASSHQARGAVLLAQGRPVEALAALRDACRRWLELDAPYDAARVRVLLAGAYTALNDPGAAALELDAATLTFEALGAGADARMLEQLRRRPAFPGGLTAREAEVLTYVAAGRSNRDIATSLVISEKTVARHLSNIFTKISVSSRTEAAAYAFTHGLAPRG